MVEFGEKFENLLHDVRKYAELKIDSIKLQAVENISQLLSDIFSIAIIFFLDFFMIIVSPFLSWKWLIFSFILNCLYVFAITS